MKVDDSQTVHFKVSQIDKSGKNQYILKSISKYGKEKNIKLKDDIRDYIIDKNGHIWTIAKEKIEYLSPSGERLKLFNGKDIKDITIDSRYNIWILDNDKIKEVYNHKIKDVYNVAKDSKEFSIYSKDNIVIKNTRGFTIKINGKDEEVLVDSYVANSAVVLKDKDLQIRILSDEYDNKSDYKMDDDVVLDITLKDDKFILNNKIRTNFSTYYNSMVYNGDVYLVRYNTLYKLKNNSMEEYVKFNKEEYNEFASSISFDKNDNIYIVGIKNIYVIDKNKNVDKIPLSKIYPDEVADENILLKDKNKDVYVITKTRKGIKFNKLDGKNFRTINYRFQDKKEPINIFLNEKDEFEFVYKDDKNGYKVYKLDENLLPQEDSRFNNEGLALMKTYNEIKNLKKTDDGKLILWIGKNMIYTKKRVEEKFIGLYDISSKDIINSMVKGKDGRVYIGTSNSGVICYGRKIDKNPANYTEMVLKQGNKVDKDKEWIIRFNKKLDKNSVNDNNIIVVREDGEVEPIKITLNEDGTSIKISPETKYKEEDYYIFINKNIKSQSGKNLKKDIYSKFTVVKSNKIEDLGRFEIMEPVNVDIKNKEVVKTVINKWKDNIEAKAHLKNNILKVGKVSIKEVKIAYDTAYILFNAEILNKVNDKIEKSEKNIGLNCKRINKSWNIIE
nr:Ig-like domain-containing protein [Clostridium botulinum]